MSFESQHAVHPRVVLSKEAEKCQRREHARWERRGLTPHGNVLLCDGDGWTFINYLDLLFDDPDDPEPLLLTHRDRVVTFLGRHRDDKRVWEKYPLGGRVPQRVRRSVLVTS